MAITKRCDYCGEEIEQGQPYVTFSVDGSHSDGRWTSGYVGHYHADGRDATAIERALAPLHRGGQPLPELDRADGGTDCWARVDEILRMAHEWGSMLESIPTADRETHGVDESPEPIGNDWRQARQRADDAPAAERAEQTSGLLDPRLVPLGVPRASGSLWSDYRGEPPPPLTRSHPLRYIVPQSCSSARRALSRAGFETVGDFLDARPEALAAIRGIGTLSLRRIEERLIKYGIRPPSRSGKAVA